MGKIPIETGIILLGHKGVWVSSMKVGVHKSILELGKEICCRLKGNKNVRAFSHVINNHYTPIIGPGLVYRFRPDGGKSDDTLFKNGRESRKRRRGK